MKNIYEKIMGLFSNKYFVAFLLVLLFSYLSIPELNLDYRSDNLTVTKQEGFYLLQSGLIDNDIKIPYSEILTGIDIDGGIVLQYDADVSELPEDQRIEALNNVKKIIETRIANLGIAETSVVTSVFNDEYRLNVELPGFENIETAKETLGATAELEFRLENTINAEQLSRAIDDLNDDYSLLIDKIRTDPSSLTELETEQYFQYLQRQQQLATEYPVYESTEPRLTGRDIERASVSVDPTSGLNQVVVNLNFTDEGTEKFRNITKDNIGKRLAVYLDNQIIQSPIINQEIPSGEAQISGGFTIERANLLKDQLNAGALPVPVTVINEKYIGPFLGTQTVRKSVLAGIIGVLLVIVFMAINYRKLVFITLLNVFLYTTISLFIYRITHTPLTLPGIAGFIMSIGLAIDSNILIFERLKEERLLHGNTRVAINNALTRSFTSIRDANLATFIASMVLYNPFNFGFLPVSSLVKGFSITLAYGVLVGLFTGYYVTRLILKRKE